MNRSSALGEKKVTENYGFLQTLGEGNFAKVKLATHFPTLQKVAVKVIDRSRFSAQDDSIRLRREISIMKKIDHPHVIRLLEVIETPKKAYLVMEYASGGDLMTHILSEGRIADAVARSIMHQLVSGVGYLHGLRVSHRDLKPANILLTERGEVKIADFGLSNSFGDEGLLQTRCGSPCFIAPEMVAGRLYDGRSADVWSLGVILFFMLTGRLPFEDENRPRLFRKILSGRFLMPKTICRDAKDLVKRMLTVDPKDRISLAEISAHAWMRLGDSPTVGLKDSSHLHSRALVKMMRLGYDSKNLMEDLQMRAKNSATATYFLLLRKMERRDVEALQNHTQRSPGMQILAEMTIRGRDVSIERKSTTPGRRLIPLSPQLAFYAPPKALALKSSDAPRLFLTRHRTLQNSTMRTKSPL